MLDNKRFNSVEDIIKYLKDDHYDDFYNLWAAGFVVALEETGIITDTEGSLILDSLCKCE